MRRCAFGLMLLSGLAQAEPFVFQGQLNDGGAPADGVYDLEFLLYDAASGGSQISTVQSVEDLSVSNGSFTTELDFGDEAFDGSQRWVEIRVRDGDSVDAFTLLDPRAKIGSAPQAGFATKAGVAETLSNPFWTQAPGILFFGEDGGNDKVFINRNRVVENTDTFVIQSNMNGMGGMTLSNWTNGMPYYGYATGGFSRVKTYYDPLTDAWVVNKGGDQLEIDANNDVIITNNLIVGGTITQLGDGGGGGGVVVGYKSFTPDMIFEGFNFNRVFNSFAGATVSAGSGSYLRADLDLPHGSEITNIRVEFVDRLANPNLSFQLWRRDLITLEYSSEVLNISTGADANMVQVMDINLDPGIVIDNTECTYGLRAFSTSGTWPALGNMGIRTIVVEYETTIP